MWCMYIPIMFYDHARHVDSAPFVLLHLISYRISANPTLSPMLVPLVLLYHVGILISVSSDSSSSHTYIYIYIYIYWLLLGINWLYLILIFILFYRLCIQSISKT